MVEDWRDRLAELGEETPDTVWRALHASIHQALIEEGVDVVRASLIALRACRLALVLLRLRWPIPDAAQGLHSSPRQASRDIALLKEVLGNGSVAKASERPDLPPIRVRERIKL
jgi:hypothetical protein